MQKKIFQLIIAILFMGFPAFFVSCKQAPTPPALAAGTSIAIRYASFSWKSDKDFRRISEYFTGTENSAPNAVYRSHEESRAGLYLMLGIEIGAEIPENSRVKLSYRSPFQKELQVREWTIRAFTGMPHSELRFGLTGEDWQEKHSRKKPSAWKISIFSPEGEKLLERESYLWVDPEIYTK